MLTVRRRILLGRRLQRAQGYMSKWHSCSPQECDTFQLQAVQARWAEAIRHVPYYRQRVERGEAPAEITSLEQYVSEVPVLTRAELLEHRDDFQRTDPPHFMLQTAGSTGEPLQFGSYRDETALHTGLQQWVARFSNGMTCDGRVFLLWGHSHLLGSGFAGAVRDRVRRMKDALVGYTRVDAYRVEPHLAHDYFKTMQSFRPQVVIGYACALDMFARYNMDEGRSARDLGVKLCVACSENFPKEDSREVIGDWLGCPVLMEYGGVDFGVCAHEVLNAPGFHTFWWSHLLETDGHADDGAVRVTNLTHRYLPLFRYENGDEVRGADPSSPASPHIRSFEALGGRTHDMLDMPDGTSIHSMGVFHSIHQEPVLAIQLVVRPHERRIRLAARELSEDAVQRIRGRLASLHPDLAQYPIDVVPDVATNRAGKRRWIVHES